MTMIEIEEVLYKLHPTPINIRFTDRNTINVNLSSKFRISANIFNLNLNKHNNFIFTN
jgi:hypothetical protein